MKTNKNVLIIFCLLLTGSIFSELFAQKNLDAMREKYKQTFNISMATRYSSGKSSSEIDFISETMEISNNKPLLNDFLEAFKKDMNVANTILEKKKDGKVFSLVCHFGDDTDRVTYSYTIDDKEDMVVNYIKGNTSQLIDKKELTRTINSMRARELKGRATYRKDGAKISRETAEMAKKGDLAKRLIAAQEAINALDILNKKIYINPIDTNIFIINKETNAQLMREMNLKLDTLNLKNINMLRKFYQNPKFMIPEGGYLIVNGEKLTAEQARKRGYDVSEFSSSKD